MDKQRTSAIERLVEAHGGPTAVSRALGGSPAYQQIQIWVSRGWAAPKYFLRLEPLLPDGLTLHDLYADITAEKAAA